MIAEERLKIFERELSFIRNEDIKYITEETVKILPDYFFDVAASSTGKYHPSYSLGRGGLVRHTKSAVRIAIELFNNSSVNNFNELEKDITISALILHDGVKHGLSGGKHTITEHPLLSAKLIDELELDEEQNDLKKEIQLAIEAHMGEWCFDYKTKIKVLPTPRTKIERFVHLCDYLSSRRCLEFNFNVLTNRK